MRDFTSHLLRAYFTSTDWQPHNSYLHLTSSSSSILLDFNIPTGLSFSISSSSSPTFFSTHKLRALPDLAGSLGYVFAKTDRPLQLGIGGPDGTTSDLKLRDVLERFRVVNVPSNPSSAPGADRGPSPSKGEWADKLNSTSACAPVHSEVHTPTVIEDSLTRFLIHPLSHSFNNADYLLYGCIHAPSSRLDVLYTTRISPAWNFILTACSFPPRPPPVAVAFPPATANASPAVNADAPASYQPQGPTSPGATNLQLILQNDTGKWFNEFSYSADDALWGFRTMHHFGASSRSLGDSLLASRSSSKGQAGPSQQGPNDALAPSTSPVSSPFTAPSFPHLYGPASSISNLRNDDELSAEAGGGLKGRFSAGAELFFSAAEKSAGLSTGIRFTTLPEEVEEEASHAFSSSSPSLTTPSWLTDSPTRDAPTTSSARASSSRLPPSQPPTTITATLNPMMGHLSSAYAAQVGRDTVVCSR